MVTNIAVQASLAMRFGNDVPQANPMFTERRQARVIGHSPQVGFNNLLYQPPELIDVLVNLTSAVLTKLNGSSN